MSFYTNKFQPLVASCDITVYKSALDFNEDIIKSIRAGVSFTLNKLIKPKDSLSISLYGYGCYKITSGVVGSFLYPSPWCVTKENPNSFISVIPKGTKYWVCTDGITIASEELFVTDQIADATCIVDKNIAEILYSESPVIDGYRIGSLSNNGIVVGSHIKPLIASPYIYLSDIRMGCTNTGEPYYEGSSALEDFNGVSHTKSWISNGDMEILSYIDWDKGLYLPALGELLSLLNNWRFVLAGASLNNIDLKLELCKWYWSSTEQSFDKAWGAHICNGAVCQDWYDKNSKCRIIPFLET